MEIVGDVVYVQSFITLTMAIIVLFVGRTLNERIGALRDFNISVSVSGGLLVSILLTVIYFVFGVEFQFDVSTRAFLLVYFFTAVGISTKIGDILAARRVLLIMLVAVLAFMAVQDAVALSMSGLLGNAGPEALLAGTVALTGGRQTVLAWAPIFVEEFGIANAAAIGVASATVGLVIGSLVGGPTARYLIKKHRLQPEGAERQQAEAVAAPGHRAVDAYVFLRSILAIHICVIVGFAVNQVLAEAGIILRLPIACFFVAIFVTNVIPRIMPRVAWPSRSSAMFLIAELSLGILFGMSLINARLWTIIDLPIQHLTILLVQVAATVAVTILIIFRIMGRDHDATVMCSGFAGLVLGSTATAMANMKAVAKHAGTSHLAFIILPLVAVICIDGVNKFLIQAILAWF